MMKTISIDKAIELATNKESLEGLAIENLGSTQLRAKDALLLARHGVLIPEQNIFYSDEDVAYDEEFDDYEWTPLKKGISIEELSDLSENYNTIQKPTLNIEIELEDKEAMQWAEKNYPLLKSLFNNIFKDFYTSKSLLDR